jgi:hypothetical protein
MTDPALHEMFVLWPAWQTIVEYVSREDARTVEPQSVYGAACAADQDRLAARLYAHAHADSVDDGRDLLADLLLMARDGVRPRYGREMGFTREMFE